MAFLTTTSPVASRGIACSGLRCFSLAAKIGILLSVILCFLVSALVYWYAFVRPSPPNIFEGEENQEPRGDIIVEVHSTSQDISPDSTPSSSPDRRSDQHNPQDCPPPPPITLPPAALPPPNQAHGIKHHPRPSTQTAVYSTHHLVPGAPPNPLFFIPVGMAMPPCPPAPPPTRPIIPLSQNFPGQSTRDRPSSRKPRGRRQHPLRVPAASQPGASNPSTPLATEPSTPTAPPTASPPSRPTSSLDLYSQSRLHDLVDRSGARQNGHQAEGDGQYTPEAPLAPTHHRRLNRSLPSNLGGDDHDGAARSRTGRHWRDVSLPSAPPSVGNDNNNVPEASWLAGARFPGAHTRASSSRPSTDRHRPRGATPRHGRHPRRERSSSCSSSRGAFPRAGIRRAEGRGPSQDPSLAETEVSTMGSFSERGRSPPSAFARRTFDSRSPPPGPLSPASFSSASASTTIRMAAAAAADGQNSTVASQNPTVASQVSSTGAVCSLEGSGDRSDDEDAEPDAVGRWRRRRR